MTTATTARKFNIAEEVTNKLIDALESGAVPWQKPWTAAGAPRNGISKKAYRGINVWLLLATKYADPRWYSYKQVESLGGNVKGQKSTMVIFWKIIDGEDKETGKVKKIPLLRYFNVFNAEQIGGVDFPSIAVQEHNAIEEAEAIIDGMPNAPVISYDGGDHAYYVPLTDSIHLPIKTIFRTSESYYSTAFHELAHSTGHASRLARHIDGFGHFGDEKYSKEELVAEMTAAMLSATVGIETTFDNSVAYLQSWLRALKNDKSLAISAGAQAQKAYDYIMAGRDEEEGTEE